jgi:hypothetical protein
MNSLHLKKTALLSALLMGTLALSACGGKKDEFAAEPPAPGANPADVAAPAAAAGAAVARAEVPAGAQFALDARTEQEIVAMKETAACSLENIVTMADMSTNAGSAPNSYSVTKGKAYKLIGFATNKDTGSVPANIRLTIVGPKVYAIDTVTGSNRPDVATYFKVPAFANAGYQADAAFDDVEPGEYRVFAIEKSASGDAIACPTHQTLVMN